MKRALYWFTIVSVAIFPGFAQEEEDVPGKGVARLSLISGDVSVRRGDTGEWVAGAVNGPLVEGDYIQAGAGSRAEIQFDWANLIRLSSNTEVRLPQLENARYQIQLAQGIVTLSAVRDSDAQVDVNTPSVSVRPVRKGRYRIEVRDDADGRPVTEVTVRSGEVEVYSPQGIQRLTAGRAIQIRGEFSSPEFQNVAAVQVDDWDRWNERRDKELLRSASYQHTPQGVYGVEDLDGHGSWVDSPQYGRVWAPAVAAGWAPYQNGRWAWMDYYGWSWVSYDPWGWAPYHYGRWFWNANRWCWWPGQRSARTFWRPALVAWVGWGSGGVGMSVGGGWGRVGWVPLAPYERFRPWYGRNWYGGNHNHTTIINNINVTNVYRNSRVNHGVTVVQAQSFGRGTMNRVRLESNDLNRAYTSYGRLPMVPDRASTHLSDRAVSGSMIQSGNGNRQFFSRTPVMQSRQVSFEEQRQGIERVNRQAFSGSQIPQNGAAIPGAGRSMAGSEFPGRGQRGPNDGQRASSPADRSGWRRMGEPRQSEMTSHENSTGTSRMDRMTGSSRMETQGERRGGWQRFGEPRNSTQNASVPQTSGRSSNSWSRFGESPQNGSPATSNSFGRGSTRMDQDNGNEIRVNPPVVRERGFGRGSSSGATDRSSAPPMSRSERMNSGGFGRGMSGSEIPRSSMPSGRDNTDRGNGGGRSMSAPPSAPRMSPGSGGGMGRGSGSPSMRGGGSAPPSGPSMSAPSRSSGAPMGGGSGRSGGSGPSGNRGPGGGGGGRGR